MLPCFDGWISRSNAQTSQEKDVPCVYLTMNKLSIWGSREESRVSGTRKAMCLPLYMIQGGLFV